jgi:hypothetical protein
MQHSMRAVWDQLQGIHDVRFRTGPGMKGAGGTRAFHLRSSGSLIASWCSLRASLLAGLMPGTSRVCDPHCSSAPASSKCNPEREEVWFSILLRSPYAAPWVVGGDSSI